MARPSHSCRRLERVLITLACAGVLALSTGTTAGAANPLGDGVVAAASPSTVTLASSPNPSTSGQPVVFTASVACGATPASGLVTFLDGASTIGTASLDSMSTATFSTADLEPGPHSVTSVFAATPDCDASTSPPFVQQVERGASFLHSRSRRTPPSSADLST